MTAPLVLALFVVVTALVAPRYLLSADWVHRSPSLGIVAWQAATVAVLSSITLIGLTLALPILPVGPQLAALVRTAHLDVVDHYETPAGNGLAALALLGAGGILLRAVHFFAAEVRTATRHRRQQLEGLQLVGAPHPAGFTVIDHSLPLVYCLPGRRRTLVVTSAALEALTPTELDSVLAHERAHLRARHDLALILSAALARTFGGMALFATAHEQVGTLVEMQADDAARTNDSRRAMATALLILGSSARPAHAGPQPIGTAADRVRRLIGTRALPATSQRFAVGIGAVAILATPVALALSPALEASTRDCCHVAISDRPLQR